MIKFKHVRRPVPFGKIDIHTTLDEMVITRLDKNDLENTAEAVEVAKVKNEEVFMRMLRKKLDAN